MPMSFPDMQSLAYRAKMRNFRQPLENESEEDYREAFATFMDSVDRMEATEIRLKDIPVDFVKEADPLTLLSMLSGRSRDDMSDLFKSL